MTDAVRRIAETVLYEGYILWPYRRSALKNTRRWTFGGVYPRTHSETHPDDPWTMQTQILARGEPDFEVGVRFLHIVRRQVTRAGEEVDELVVGGERHLSWEEATERELTPGRVAIPAGREEEPLGGEAAIVRSWRALEGEIETGTEELEPGLWRLTVRIANTTPFAGTREEALAQTFCSCHTIVRGSGLLSVTDPPEDVREIDCENRGTWPVLVGENTVLSSPIILEDNPGIAPESPGDLFDGGEIDQLLTLNILSLTDEEKEEMRATDPRAREILERTESLTPEQLMSLHGRIRELH